MSSKGCRQPGPPNNILLKSGTRCSSPRPGLLIAETNMLGLTPPVSLRYENRREPHEVWNPVELSQTRQAVPFPKRSMISTSAYW